MACFRPGLQPLCRPDLQKAFFLAYFFRHLT